LTGQPLEPVLAATAAGQCAGHLGAGHIRVIRSFWHQLPARVEPEKQQSAEADLAELGEQHRPDELAKLAAVMTDCLVPDGVFSDADRARRRALILGRQDADGMSPITGTTTPSGCWTTTETPTTPTTPTTTILRNSGEIVGPSAQ
jgi:hypothetical protein